MPRRSAEGDAFTELVLEVFRLNGLLLAAGDQLAEPSGLTSARWQVLGVVDHEPAPVANVARIMGLTPPARAAPRRHARAGRLRRVSRQSAPPPCQAHRPHRPRPEGTATGRGPTGGLGGPAR